MASTECVGATGTIRENTLGARDTKPQALWNESARERDNRERKQRVMVSRGGEMRSWECSTRIMLALGEDFVVVVMAVQTDAVADVQIYL